MRFTRPRGTAVMFGFYVAVPAAACRDVGLHGLSEVLSVCLSRTVERFFCF